jgi:hypothetical protein
MHLGFNLKYYFSKTASRSKAGAKFSDYGSSNNRQRHTGAGRKKKLQTAEIEAGMRKISRAKHRREEQTYSLWKRSFLFDLGEGVREMAGSLFGSSDITGINLGGKVRDSEIDGVDRAGKTLIPSLGFTARHLPCSSLYILIPKFGTS